VKQGAVCAEIEASKGEGRGGMSPPQTTRGSGVATYAAQRGPRQRAPAENGLWCILSFFDDVHAL